MSSESVSLRGNRFWITLSSLVFAVMLTACDGHGSAFGTGAVTVTPSGNVDCGGRPTLKASGSTAQEYAMARFAKDFERACPGQSVTYTPNGSGAGISEFTGNQTDFGSSDSPLNKDEYASAERRCGSPAWNLPVVFGPIAIAYRVNGRPSLALDGSTAARIFNGGIVAWNDPAIQALNPGVTLPDEPIRVVFRSDESGTTDNFQRYLDTASHGAWGRVRGGSSTAASARASKAMTALLRRSVAPKDLSPTSNGRSRKHNTWTWPRSSRRPVRIRWRSAQPRWAKRFRLPGSSGKATTSHSTPSRSTGRTCPAPTRSYWRHTRSCARSIPMPRSVSP
ncbi:phosphate-binding protein pstS 3 [Mycobacterium kansasii]|uniref:Phosphate-binding protein pstS 3 n=1 Tax=Mycobacterium kansasii TaxID=1768 RepID=A0A1V3WL24_MYCKA|nr:phosphate-binding protein pstS 3 [Mycobacterium kansasii]